jgi:citrate synthase
MLRFIVLTLYVNGLPLQYEQILELKEICLQNELNSLVWHDRITAFSLETLPYGYPADNNEAIALRRDETMPDTPYQCEYIPGLSNIPAAQSSISFVDGQRGLLEYRGIPIEELAQKSTFIETAYLLIWGHLPAQAELNAFEQDIRQHRRLKYRVRDMMKCFPDTGHPMDALQTAAASLGLFHSRRALDNPDYIRQAVIRLLAKIPTVVAASELIRHGNDPIRPNDQLDYAANFLYMLTERKPTPLSARIFDQSLILHAEHTMNTSTFSALVTASTLTDPYAVVASAVGTLAGPLHGGAAEDSLDLLEAIGSVDQVRPYVDHCIETRQKIIGFGHRVYKVKDPRAGILQNLAEQLFDELGYDPYYDIALELEKVVEEKLGSKGIHVNVDFYSGLVYRRLGIPKDLFTPIFAIARVAGWLAHWKEQLDANRIFRPTQIYAGEHAVPYVPIDQRKRVGHLERN